MRTSHYPIQSFFLCNQTTRNPPSVALPRLSPRPQDFTQAELLLSLRVVSDPNGIALFGDTCQTIARGIGFRFGTPPRGARPWAATPMLPPHAYNSLPPPGL